MTHLSCRWLLAGIALGFAAGIAFQKWIVLGNVISGIQKSALHSPIQPEPELPNGSTFCILALGQSNIANDGESRGNAGPGVYCLHAGSFSEARDPLPGSSGNAGSVWTRLAPLLLQKRKDLSAVVISSVAQGGSGIDTWLPGGRNHDRVLAAIHDYKARRLEIDAVVWHQGETEAWAQTTGTGSYRRDLESIIASIRKEGLTCPVYVCQTSRDINGAINPAIRLAQASTWNSERKVFAGADTDSLDSSFRRDGVHFNDAGLVKFSELLEGAMAANSTGIAFHFTR